VLEGMVVRNDDFGAPDIRQHFWRHEFSGFIIIILIGRLQPVTGISATL
jgi:hypothetical protein